MLKVKNVALLLVVALLISVGAVFAQDDAGTIVDIAAGDENFSTLVSLVQAAGLVDALSGEGPFTVFAPTNEAFAELPDFVVEYLQNNPDVLAQVLQYHVIEGAVLSTDITEAMSVATLDMGNEIDVTVDDMGVTVNNADVVMADIEASNGVIHVIDTVLIPPVELPAVVPADVSGDIITAGSSTVGPLTVALADRFISEGYTGEISVAIIGSGAGFERFCEAGETDISNASRGIRPEEIESCEAIGRTPIEFRVGTDALAVVVNPSNEFASNMTVEELAAAFSTAETWADVNPEWPAEPILRFAPGTDSGTFDYFVEEVLGEDESLLLNAGNVQFSEDDNVLVEGVANNPFAIGFFGFAFYADNQEVLKILSVDGVEATAANVDAGEYPLARPLFIYSDAGVIAEKPQVLSFISYYIQNVNDVLISDVTAQSALVTDEEGNVIEYDIAVAYFEANPYALRKSVLEIIALQAMSMGGM